MKQILPGISRIVFYALVVVLIIWTGSNTLNFLGRVLPDLHVVRYAGLIIFDAGAVAWLLVFLYHAEGTGQKVIAVLASVLDLLGVLIMVGGEVLLGGQTFAVVPEGLGTIAVYSVAIWSGLNLVAVFGFHISDVNVMQQMTIKAARDAITSESLKQLERKTSEISEKVADELSDRLVTETLVALSADKYLNGHKETEANPTPGGGR